MLWDHDFHHYQTRASGHFVEVLPVHRQLVIGIYAMLQGPTYENSLQINIAIKLVVKAHGW